MVVDVGGRRVTSPRTLAAVQGLIGLSEANNQTADQIKPLWPPIRSWERIKVKYGGMKNVTGNNCYVSASLQLLLHIPPVVEWLKASCKKYHSSCLESCVTCELMRVLQQLQTGHTADPSHFLDKMHYISPFLSPDRQEDAHEFLVLLLDKLEEEFVSALGPLCQFDEAQLRTSPLNQILGFFTKLSSQCLVCHHKEQFTLVNSLMLNLHPSTGHSVLKLLQNHFTEIQESRCETTACNKAERSKRYINNVQKIPLYVVLQIKRFHDYDKDCSNIQLNERISIKGVALNLTSVMVHIGMTINGGHYVTYVRDKDMTGKETWMCYNDSNVTICGSDVLETPHLMQNACILVYEREVEVMVVKASPINTKWTITPSKEIFEMNTESENPPPIQDLNKSNMDVIKSATDVSGDRPADKVKKRLFDESGMSSKKRAKTDDCDVMLPKNRAKTTPSNKTPGKKAETNNSGTEEPPIKFTGIQVELPMKKPDSRSIGIQVELPYMAYDVWSKKYSSKFLHYTGLSLGNFNVVYNLLGGDFRCSKLKYKYNASTPVREYPRPKLSLRSCLFLVLVRIRRGIPLEDLADQMGISAAHAGIVFYTWVRYMYLVFKNLDIPMAVSAKDQKKGKPACFRPFSKLRMILDCTEFRMEKLSNLRHQGNTHSAYKGTNTLKFGFGCSTHGGTSWVSGGYEGRISDKALMRKEAFVEILHEEDMVLVDRGFPIDDLLAPKRAKVIRPPSFKRGQTHLTAKDEAATKAVAMVRIYVEHLIGRVKFWRLLRERIEVHLIPYISDIVYIAAFCCNFDRPYISRKKDEKEKKRRKCNIDRPYMGRKKDEKEKKRRK